MRAATLREPKGAIARTRKRKREKEGGGGGKTVREKRVIGLARERLSSSLFQTIPGGRFSHRRVAGISPLTSLILISFVVALPVLGSRGGISLYELKKILFCFHRQTTM